MPKINYLDRALETFNAGFTVKARQQEALADVTCAYEQVRRQVQDACLTTKDRNPETGRMNDAVENVYWNLADYPHNFKQKHVDMIRAAFGTEQDEAIAQMQYLAQLRNEIKAAPITPAAKDDTLKQVERRVQESIQDMIARKVAQFHHGVELVEIFGNLPVSVVPHYAVHQSGTGFIRCFYYMNGKLTALNVILAVLDATRKED